MARGGVIFLVAITILAVHVGARTLPSGNTAGLNDEKNVMNYEGVGGYSGIGDNGLPIGGVFGGVGSGADIGRVGGFGGIGGGIGTGGAGGGIGTGGLGGLGSLPGSRIGTGNGVPAGIVPFP